MIITRTPYRVSFFGGGTDLPAWYTEHGGAVLTSSIGYYTYVCARFMPAFLGTKYRVFWSKMEAVDRIEDIQHPSVRACLQYLGVDQGFEVNHAGDLPARSGLGSSSAFTVGLLHALYTLQGYRLPNQALAGAAVHVEQNVLKETVGIQDQIECAIGGLNVIRIDRSGDWEAQSVVMTPGRMEALQARLMLFWTGLQRTSSEIQSEQIAAVQKNTENLHAIRALVDLAVDGLLTGQGADFDDFGVLLDEAWRLKRSLTHSVSNDQIDALYGAAKSAGALGGKLLGAGGGGFLLLYVRPEDQPKVRAALPGLLEVPFRFESEGTRLILA